MTSDPNEKKPDFDSAVDGGDVEGPYQPHYSEPSFETSSPDADWEVPTYAATGLDEPAESASAPDASPLLDEQVDQNKSQGQGQFWNEGAPVSGATSNSQPIPPQ